jgi:hypothetical protein
MSELDLRKLEAPALLSPSGIHPESPASEAAFLQGFAETLHHFREEMRELFQGRRSVYLGGGFNDQDRIHFRADVFAPAALRAGQLVGKKNGAAEQWANSLIGDLRALEALAILQAHGTLLDPQEETDAPDETWTREARTDFRARLQRLNRVIRFLRRSR